MRNLLKAWLAALVVTSHGAALAAPPSVAVQLGPCDDVDDAAVARLLRVELGERWTEGNTAVDIETYCADERVVLRATDRRGRRAQRELAVDDVRGDVGARILVLQMIELLRDLESAPSIPVPPPLPPEPEAPPPPTPDPVQAFVGPALQTFEFDSTLFGGAIFLEAVALEPLYGRLGASMVFDSTEVGGGRVETSLLTGQAEVGLRQAWPRAALEFGAGYRIARAQLRGSSEDDSQVEGKVSGVWGGPYLGLRGQVRLLPRLLFELGADVGGTASPVVGIVADSDDVRLDGLWAAAHLGVGTSF